MNCSTPGLAVHHQLPEFTQICVHRVSDAIQPSHPLSSPSLPAPNSSKHQSLFQWVNSSHEVAKVLEFQPQPQSFQWTPRTDLFRVDWLDLLAVQGTRFNIVIIKVSAELCVHVCVKWQTDSKTYKTVQKDEERQDILEETQRWSRYTTVYSGLL